MNRNLYVIDGLDGCGKTTQHDLLINKLSQENFEAIGISFPDYNENSSALVRMYLSGEFGSHPSDVNAYAASSFYAVDRYASFKKYWQSDYNSGKYIIAARYTSSNLFHQMTKLDKSEWDDFINWVEDFEFNKLGIPRPNKVIFLDVETDVAIRLISERYNGDESRKDIHEKDIDYLRKCREVALYVSNKCDYNIISCVENGFIRDMEDIQKQIQDIIFN